MLVTLHRPALVDDPDRLGAVLAVLRDVAGGIPVVFPVHPRTRARLEAAGIASAAASRSRRSSTSSSPRCRPTPASS